MNFDIKINYINRIKDEWTKFLQIETSIEFFWEHFIIIGSMSNVNNEYSSFKARFISFTLFCLIIGVWRIYLRLLSLDILFIFANSIFSKPNKNCSSRHLFAIIQRDQHSEHKTNKSISVYPYSRIQMGMNHHTLTISTKIFHFYLFLLTSSFVFCPAFLMTFRIFPVLTMIFFLSLNMFNSH